MQNYSTTGDMDFARLINTFAANGIGINDIPAAIGGGSGGGGGRANAPADPYAEITQGLTKDYLPIRSQGRMMSRSVDPATAFASLQNDTDFQSLPADHQERVLQARGGAPAVQRYKLAQQLTRSSALMRQRMAERAVMHQADDAESPMRMIKRKFERGDLQLQNGQLVSKEKSPDGSDKWVPANPYILGHAVEQAPRLGYGEIPLNDAQQYGLQLRRSQPHLPIAKIDEMIKARFEGVPSFNASGATSAAAKNDMQVPAGNPVAAPTQFDPRQFGAHTGRALRDYSAWSGDVREKTPAFVLSILNNLKGMGQNVVAGGANLIGGMTGAESDVMDYTPLNTPEDINVPDWLKKTMRVTPFPIP